MELNQERKVTPIYVNLKRKKIMEHLYTVEEAADYLGVSKKTIYNWINEGRLKASRLGKRMLRIESFDLINFIKPNN